MGQRAWSEMMSRRLRLAWIALQKRRLRDLWFGALATTCYRRLLLLERPIVDTLPEPDPGVTVAPLIESEIPEYLLLDRETDADTARSRMRLGHICGAVRAGNRITSAGWVAPGPGRVRVDYLESELSLAPDEVFYYAFVTDADIRGRGIGTRDWYQMRRLERKMFGPRRGLAAVLPENRASLAICLKLGYVAVGRMGYIKIGPWRQDFLLRRRAASQAVLGSDSSWPAT